MPTLAQFTPQVDIQLKDAGALAADAAWQVAGSDRILDLGGPSQVGRILTDLHIDVTVLDIDGNDELYRLHWQVSQSSTFASGIVSPFIFELGALEVLTGGQDIDSTIGHYVFPVSNDFGGTLFRFGRGFLDVTGATVSINFQAWLAERH